MLFQSLAKGCLSAGMLLSALSVPEALAQTGSNPSGGSVTLAASHQTASTITTGQTNTFAAQFTNTGAAATVLIDIELYNSNNQKVAQRFLDNITIPQGGITEFFSLTSPANLPPDTYRWAVGVFRPNWTELISWHNQVLTFMVTTDGQPGNVVLTSSQLVQAGNVATLNAVFTNTGQSRTVLLDLELHNSTGQKVAQRFLNNVTIGRNEQVAMSLTSPVLAPGIYTFKAGVFNPDWTGLLQWFDNVQQFAVTSPVPAGEVVLSSSAVIPAARVAPFSFVSFQAHFTTPVPPSRPVLLDLELYNSAGQRVAQKFEDNVVITGGMHQMSLALPGGLPAGRYTFKVGIFRPNWIELIQWHDNVQTLVVE